MTVHKLTAGSGYTYLSRQVAANDATERGFDSLGDYYSAKGEAPGVWLGAGLANVPEFFSELGVTESQMAALFGEGKHPNAAEIAARPEDLRISVDLGAPYKTYDESRPFQRRLAGTYRDHAAALGLPVDASIPPKVRARLRTELATDMFVETYGRPPFDARELAGHLARISRSSTTAVAGFDLTFSPVKSVSTLWAIAPREVAAVIEQAHDDAVTDTLRWIEQNAIYTRRGKNGVRQVDVHGLLAAAFTHRDSRAGDPDLHTHVAISNKVQAVDDGQWLALDGRPIYSNAVAASERYNTRLEAFLVQRLGVRFADRQAVDQGKQPVREIVGVDGQLPQRWSSRRAAIDTRRAELTAVFQADHGRPPTTPEAIALAQQANLETRQAKHKPRSHAEQRAIWRAEAVHVLGSTTALDNYVNRAVAHRRSASQHQQCTPPWVDRAATAVLATVQSGRATWKSHHVRAEAERRARADGLAAVDVDRAVDAVVTEALGRSIALRGGSSDAVGIPPALLRRDGSSVYTVAGSALYTSTEVLAAEERIVATAGRHGGRTVNESVLSETLATHEHLNPDQTHLVRDMATSGAQVQLALAPAGTGKTTAMRALAAAWTTPAAEGRPGGRVVGLAPSAAAAAVLCDELREAAPSTHTDTLAKLVHAVTASGAMPDWVAKIDEGTLVVIDEAGMAGTVDLATAIDYITGRGGVVRLVGDDQQLAAVGAGGVLRDIAATHGAITLSHVMRFTHPEDGRPNNAEGAASLALRDGDPAALAFYTDNGRVHVGDLSTATNDAYAAWSAARAAGRDAVLLAPTRDLVAELNTRARHDRITASPEPVDGEAQLADGSRVSAGDVIVTRKNDRRLTLTATDWVKNGDRWTVETVRESGALAVVHLRTGLGITLPADYVCGHVTLGYATTVHGAQGITADASFTVAAGSETRQLLYVALTRGRSDNHVYLATATDGDPHSAVTREALLPLTAIDILTRVLNRDGSPVSATSAGCASGDPAARLGDAVDRYVDALGVAAPGHLGQDRPDPDAHYHPRVGPLPWLPAVPADLLATTDWGRYLAHNASAVASLAEYVVEDARTWTRASAPPWATSFVDRSPDCTTLVADLAVWRAANHVEPTDPRATGRPLVAEPAAHQQLHLEQRVRDFVCDQGTATRWSAALADIDDRILQDPYWPVLERRLAVADRAGVDVVALARSGASKGSLPDEQPAAALWWRLVGRLGHATETAENSVWSSATTSSHDLASVAGAGVTSGDDARWVTNDNRRHRRDGHAGSPSSQTRSDGNRGVDPRHRLLELNLLAAEFFAGGVQASWVPAYLASRFGVDGAGRLLDEKRFAVGYAPGKWVALTTHLRRLGASDAEIVAAGLGWYASTGRVVDRFRDRAVMPIRALGTDGELEVHGFIGRRSPDFCDPGAAGPKYLNTGETALFTKRRELFGLAENRDLLDRGAVPVLVEGPFDAYAITLAGGGDYVGVSALGATLSDSQADALRPWTGHGRGPVLVATDTDHAGRLAAHRAFWPLAIRGNDPLRPQLDGHKDPAQFIADRGGPELVRRLRSALPLSHLVITDGAQQRGRLSTVEGRVESLRAAVKVIVALPPIVWRERLAEVIRATGVAEATALQELLAAHSSWSAELSKAMSDRPVGDNTVSQAELSPSLSSRSAFVALSRSNDPATTKNQPTNRSPRVNTPSVGRNAM